MPSVYSDFFFFKPSSNKLVGILQNKSNASGGRHNTLVLMVSVATFLLAFSSRATNAEPTAPAQVAAAVAAATGTDEKLAGQPVAVETSPSSAADCVNQPHVTAAFSPAPQLPQEVEAISSDYSTGSQTSMTDPQPQLQAEDDGGNSNSYHKVSSDRGNRPKPRRYAAVAMCSQFRISEK